MIYVGYTGVGKSTLAGTWFHFIDLESSNFIHDNDWVIEYVNVAEHTSNQGFNVFLSAHKEVREELNARDIPFVTITPTLKLKDEWIEKLKDRFDHTGKLKDEAAYNRAKNHYAEDVKDLLKENNVIKINYTPYNLLDLIEDKENGKAAIRLDKERKYFN